MESKRTVACGNTECGKRFAEIIGDGLVDFVRRGYKALVTGKDFTFSGECRFCHQMTTLIVKDGKLVEDGITFRAPKTEEDNPPPGDTPPPQPENEDEPPEPPKDEEDEEDDDTPPPPKKPKDRKLTKVV